MLTDAGFSTRTVAEVASDNRIPREFFVGTRPL